MEGQGTHTLPGGEKYVGQYKNGKRHGQGTVTFPNGHRYVGEFKNGKPHGQGTYTFPDGEKFVGEFKNGKRHGQGTTTYPNGHRYVGEWENDKRHGQGTYTFPNGKKLIGEFRNDKSYKVYEINKDNLLLSCQYVYTKNQTNIKTDPHQMYLYFDNYEYAKTIGYGIVNMYQLFDGQSNLLKLRDDFEYTISETKIRWTNYVALYLDTFQITRDSLEFIWQFVSIGGSAVRVYSCDVAKEKEIIKFYSKKDQAKKQEQDKKDDIQNRNKI